MKDNNYYTVNGWMINRLGLSGNELILYAVIYGFSQVEESYFKGSLNYLKGWINASIPTIIKALKSLVKKGLIAKHEETIDKVRRCYYQVTKESLEGGTKESLVGGTKETLVNNNKDIDIEKKKELSNDNPKKAEVLSFEDFYDTYPLHKSKQQAEKSWNRLSLKDKKAAYDRLPEYLADCARCRRNIKHPSTYLNQRTWEDDFSSTGRIRFYDPIEGDSEQKKKFKAWMRNNFPEIEDTALPLSFEDYMQLVKGDHVEDVTNALIDIHNEIYKYRKSDIAQVVKSMIPNDEEE